MNALEDMGKHMEKRNSWLYLVSSGGTLALCWSKLLLVATNAHEISNYIFRVGPHSSSGLHKGQFEHHFLKVK